MFTILNILLFIFLVHQTLRAISIRIKANDILIKAYDEAIEIRQQALDDSEKTNKLLRRIKYTNKLNDITFNYYN